jgi:hypothetical protein
MSVLRRQPEHGGAVGIERRRFAVPFKVRVASK